MSTPYLDQLLTALRFPSISTDPERVGDVLANAEWLAAKLTGIGLSTNIYPTAGHPVVVARNQVRANRPTVLLYGHYDVQPVDPLEQWVSNPFEPRIENGRIYARGSTDNKGQHMAHLCGITETLSKHGDLPVNLIFLLEGEEEIGSPNLEPFLKQHQADLACDIVAISDTGMVAAGVPTFTYGLRGIACVEVIVHGPVIDLHSGIFGGSVANPNTILSRLVASVHDAEGRLRRSR